jgi:voltage-gated potassium channel
MVNYPSIKERAELSLKEKWRLIIFEADTQEGRRFDILLLWAIVISVLTLMIDSVPTIHAKYAIQLKYIEYFFTGVFTLEYLARLLITENTKSYAFSFWGIIDLVSTIPTYLTFFFPASPLFRIVRTVRLLRIFKVLRLTRFMGEAQGMGVAIKRSGAKITVFFGVVLVIVVVMGTIMYVIEPPEGWLHFYSQKHILGNSNANHCGLRGYCSSYRTRSIFECGTHDIRLCSYCSANRDCKCRNGSN